MSDSDTAPPILWQPDEQTVRDAQLTAFVAWLARERDVELGDPADGTGAGPDYGALWSWSTTDLAGFWGAVAEFLGVRFHEAPSRVLGDDAMPGAEWFPGATLNYAEHALHPRAGGADTDLALVAVREDGRREQRTFGELRADVAAARAGLVELGVGRGDRVVALAPNTTETLVAFLAAASLGATWSSCSPDFGARAVLDRFAQIEPTVLVAVDGYLYNGKSYDVRDTVAELRAQLPSLRATVGVGYLEAGAWAEVGDGPHGDATVSWVHFVRDTDAELAFDPVPFGHPLWILYSSGTTGLPKGIVHSHGGIVVEHLKALALQHDLGPGDRFTWFTTTGWMMWNLLVSGLLVGATVVAYDGSPAHPDLDALWRMAQDEGVTLFGTSASYVQSCAKAGLRPGEAFDLSRVRAVGSTGSPLSSEGFDWIVDAVGDQVQVASVSGGTDVCSAFVGVAPVVPVWRGEISCRALGAAVEAFDSSGQPVLDEVGELVITRPMPSMPVMLWNDPDGSRMHESYFEDFPGVWRHGDWIRVTPRGSCVIRGRSDSTLNRGGIRMGTAEFYEVVEGFEEVADSLVIDTSGTDPSSEDGELLCFLVLTDGHTVDDVTPRLRSALRQELSPRHVPDRFLAVDEVPRTLNGKKCEVPVKRILSGTPIDEAVSRDALRNPDALEDVCARASRASSA